MGAKQLISALNWPDFDAARHALWVAQDPKRALKLLPASPLHQDISAMEAPLQRLCVDLAAEAYLQLGDAHRARIIFEKFEHWEGATFCSIALQDYEAGYATLCKHAESSHALWVQVLYYGCLGQLSTWPTFLNLRNRLESDVARLYQLEGFTQLDNLLSYLNSFSQINPEVFKYTARCLMYLGLNVQAQPLFQRAIGLSPIDAEGYFHLAELQLATQENQHALLLLKQVKQMAPFYTPAWQLEASL